MASTLSPYNHLLREAWLGTWRPDANPDFRVNLYTSFTFNPAHTTKSAAETGATQVATGAGYTQNAKTLSNVTATIYLTTGFIVTFDPIIWYPPSSTTLTARYALFYANGTTGQKPFMFLDFGQSESAVSPQPLIISTAANGCLSANWIT